MTEQKACFKRELIKNTSSAFNIFMVIAVLGFPMIIYGIWAIGLMMQPVTTTQQLNSGMSSILVWGVITMISNLVWGMTGGMAIYNCYYKDTFENDRKCKQCGKYIESNGIYCPWCGMKE